MIAALVVTWLALQLPVAMWVGRHLRDSAVI
jgi:hypothetical protein